MTRKELRRKVRSKLHAFGWVVYLTGAARFHDDGDGVTGVFRWWHPVTWLLFLGLIIPCAVVGERISNAVPLRVSKWFRDHPERLQWL
jgi:hypothetical protein